MKLNITLAMVALLIFLACQLGCSSTINYLPALENLSFGNHSLNSNSFNDSLLVASYNIYLGKNIDQAIADLKKNEKLAGADVLFLQEMDPDGTRQIARALHMNYVYWPSFKMGRTGRLFGNAVLSPWPITNQDAAKLPHRAPVVGFERVAVAADIQMGEHQLRAICVHLSTVVVPLEKRLDQAEAMLVGLAGFDGPIIIGGDFNTVSKNDRVKMGQLMRKAGFRATRLPPGATAERRIADIAGYELILDHFFISGLTAVSSGIDRTAETSDHFPIWGMYRWSEDR